MPFENASESYITVGEPACANEAEKHLCRRKKAWKRSVEVAAAAGSAASTEHCSGGSLRHLSGGWWVQR